MKDKNNHDHQPHATLIDVDGKETSILPQNGKHFTLSEFYKLLKCETIQIIQSYDPTNKACVMVIDEEGKMKGRDFNLPASRWFASPHKDFVVGDVLVTPRQYIR